MGRKGRPLIIPIWKSSRRANGTTTLPIFQLYVTVLPNITKSFKSTKFILCRLQYSKCQSGTLLPISRHFSIFLIISHDCFTKPRERIKKLRNWMKLGLSQKQNYHGDFIHFSLIRSQVYFIEPLRHTIWLVRFHIYVIFPNFPVHSINN